MGISEELPRTFLTGIHGGISKIFMNCLSSESLDNFLVESLKEFLKEDDFGIDGLIC